jgi:hypothetical protein
MHWLKDHRSCIDIIFSTPFEVSTDRCLFLLEMIPLSVSMIPAEKETIPGKCKFVHTSTLVGPLGSGKATDVKFVRFSSINSGILMGKVSYL